MITEEIKEEIKKKLETNDNKSTMTQKPMGCSKNSSKKQVSNTTSPQETRKISNKQSNLIPKATRERRKKPKVSWRKEIIKIRAEINEIETKKTTVKINETKSWLFEKINELDKILPRLIIKKREDLNQ